MKAIILFSLLLSSSSAFLLPIANRASSTALNVEEIDLGVTKPLGLWDPLNYLETQPEKFERRRAVERKHGRIAMAAVLGNIIHNNHIVFDGYLSPSQNVKFSDIPTGIYGLFSIPVEGLAQILIFIGLLELAWLPASQYDGNYGVGFFGIKIKDPEERERKLNAELNNGRLAMLGIMGGMVGEVVTGQTMYEQYSSGNISAFGY
jgi:hypothetical protein